MGDRRRYDIVIYGATGFTGKLGCEYVDRQYGDGALKWAIAGRSRGKLESLQRDLSSRPDVLVAAADDEAALEAMVEATKVVVTFAGPFIKYAPLLVEVCVRHGTHYCDITGEIPFVRRMISKFDDAARRSGACIVHLCGHDSVPWDLSTMAVAKKLREDHGEELRRIDMYDKVMSMPSGGTLETVFHLIKVWPFWQSDEERALGMDPLRKLPDGTKSRYALKNRNVRLWDLSRAFFFMADVNAQAVRRSNALLGYGDAVAYSEGLAMRNPLLVVLYLAGLAIGGVLLALPPTRWLLRQFVLPKPGQGLSRKAMERGFLDVRAVGTGSGGSKVRSRIRFPRDPGYLETSRMAVESGLALALEGERIASGGGVFTPAACVGEVLLERLCRTGTSFEFEG